MGIFNLSDIGRSLGSAAILLLNDLEPFTAFLQLTLDSLHSGGRLAYTYQNQTFPMTYGPLGTMILPGICVEMSTAKETYNEKHIMPIIFSVSRQILDTPELDLRYLDEMCVKLDGMLRRDNACPVYKFTDDIDDPIQIVGRVLWPTNSLILTPLYTKFVGINIAGGWIRKEYHFDIMFHMKFPD